MDLIIKHMNEKNNSYEKELIKMKSILAKEKEIKDSQLEKLTQEYLNYNSKDKKANVNFKYRFEQIFNMNNDNNIKIYNKATYIEDALLNMKAELNNVSNQNRFDKLYNDVISITPERDSSRLPNIKNNKYLNTTFYKEINSLSSSFKKYFPFPIDHFNFEISNNYELAFKDCESITQYEYYSDHYLDAYLGKKISYKHLLNNEEIFLSLFPPDEFQKYTTYLSESDIDCIKSKLLNIRSTQVDDVIDIISSNILAFLEQIVITNEQIIAIKQSGCIMRKYMLMIDLFLPFLHKFNLLMNKKRLTICLLKEDLKYKHFKYSYLGDMLTLQPNVVYNTLQEQGTARNTPEINECIKWMLNEFNNNIRYNEHRFVFELHDVVSNKIESFQNNDSNIPAGKIYYLNLNINIFLEANKTYYKTSNPLDIKITKTKAYHFNNTFEDITSTFKNVFEELINEYNKHIFHIKFDHISIQSIKDIIDSIDMDNKIYDILILNSHDIIKDVFYEIFYKFSTGRRSFGGEVRFEEPRASYNKKVIIVKVINNDGIVSTVDIDYDDINNNIELLVNESINLNGLRPKGSRASPVTTYEFNIDDFIMFNIFYYMQIESTAIALDHLKSLNNSLLVLYPILLSTDIQLKNPENIENLKIFIESVSAGF